MVTQTLVPTVEWTTPGLLFSSTLCHRRDCSCKWSPFSNCLAPPSNLMLQTISQHTLRRMELASALGRVLKRSILCDHIQAALSRGHQSSNHVLGPQLCSPPTWIVDQTGDYWVLCWPFCWLHGCEKQCQYPPGGGAGLP